MPIAQRWKIEKINKICVLIACIHWALSFLTDRFIFQYVIWDTSSLKNMVKTALTYCSKGVFLLLLIAFWHWIFWFVKKADRRLVRNTLFYFACNMVLLLLVWPGIFRMDEFGILASATRLLPVFWQSYLTSLFYEFSLMLLPFPSGVLIVQCFLIALIVGSMMTELDRRGLRQGAIRKIISWIPFLLLPVLDSNLYPMRMSLYAFLELYLLFCIGRKWLDANANTNANTDASASALAMASGFIPLALLGAVVTVWRTEAIYYFVAFPLLLWVLFYERLGGREKARTLWKWTFLYLGLSLILFLPQKVGDKLTSGSQYDLTSVVLPLVPMIEEASDRPDCEDLLAQIDQVVSVETALEGAEKGKSGISLFWSEPDFIRSDYTQEEYSQFKKAYYQLIFKCPGSFFRERANTFVSSDDLLENTTELFSLEGNVNYDTFRGYFLAGPIHEELRNRVIHVLELRDFSDYGQELILYRFCYSPVIPVMILMVFFMGAVVRRKWKVALFPAIMLIRVPLIFLTAPSRLFMYYYPFYLAGLVCLIWWILWISRSRKGVGNE